MAQTDMRLGVDLGGTKIEGVVLAPEGRVAARERVATPAGDYRATVAAVAGLVRRLEQSVDRACTVGVGTPGAISPLTGAIKNSNSTCLNGRPLRHDLEAALGRAVRVANDADCMALSEARDGAAAGAATVFGVIIGTGTGGAVVINGRLVQGPNRIAGEWGHNPLPWADASEQPGPPCYCGKHGCIETFLSGPALAADHRRHTGEAIDGAAIDRRAAAGDHAAVATLSRYCDRMARALATVINILDPHVIVLAGGVSQIGALYEEVPRRWGDYVFSDCVDTRLVPARHGNASGVRGAAWLWADE